ncbi:COG4223 family protein [Yoonia sp. R2331]|uniref:COG4223 family protein n=1 Tax=Yoonia sp. R2331 TaxID=3237238 RepID=UPI0034E39D3B
MAKEPAKPRKPRKSTKPKAETPAEEVIGATAEDVTVTEGDKSGAVAEPVPESVEDAPAEEKPVEETQTETEEKQPESTPSAPVAAAQTSHQQSIFVPLLLGGLLAGGIGYGTAYLRYADQETVEPAVSAADLAELRDEIAALPDPTDTSDLSATVGELRDEIARIDSDVAALAPRIDTLERQPSGDGTLPQTAVDAFEADMQALRDQIATQQAELAAVADQTAARLEDTRAEAIAIEQNAVEAARAATAKASLARVQGALESGAPFGGLLGELESALGGPAPEALVAVAEGTATLGSLQSDFPAAARRALSDARAEGVDGDESSGIGAFLRNQLDVRSVAPKEGAGVDATLSRAEGALREGRLNDALSEIGTLPDVARAAMSDWLTQAEARAAAIDAADTLSNSLSDN